MKLLYITAGMPYGPGEVFIIEEIREFLRRGHEVLVVPRSPGRMVPHAEDLVPATIREPLLSKTVLKCAIAQGSGYFSAVRRLLCADLRRALKNAPVVPKALWLARLATESGVDHIHCHWASTTATMAMLAAEVSRVPWSFTAHRSDIVGNNLLLEKICAAQFVRVISQDGLDMVFERGVPPHPKIRVLHVGVRLPSLPLRSKIEKRPVILCPADFLPVKGHRFLIEAWKILNSRGVPGELWLAGRGQLRHAIERTVANAGLTATVKFLGEVNNSALLDYYRTGAITATVLASIDRGNGEHEGIPTALMEAMSFAVPVIATNTGGIPELIPPGCGLLVPDKDPMALADAIGAVIRNPALADQLGRSGRLRVAESFDVTQIVSQLETWFVRSADRVEAAVRC